MSVSRRIRVAALSLALAAPLTAATVAATTAPAEAATCRYRVIFGGASPVRENPDTNSVARKYKYYGDLVSSGCAVYYDYESGIVFVEVDCTCASDGQAWMRRAYLEYLE